MKKRLVTRFRAVSHDIFRNITATRAHRRVISRFDKKIGLVYFGAVNQRLDDYRVIRGFTASSTHQDNHFSVGSIDGYDVSMVDRSDAIFKDDGSVTFSNWIIAAIDLKTTQDVPHIFIGANHQNNKSYSTLFATNPLLNKVDLGTFENYEIEFTSRFTIYSPPADSIQVEKLFPAMSARVIGAHLWPYSVEVIQGVLYVYCDTENVTSNDLTAILNIGLWLARHIDSKIEQI